MKLKELATEKIKAMSSKIEIDKKAKKFLNELESLNPKQYLKIAYFLCDILPNAENPCKLSNAKYLKGYKDNRWRWRIGDYRIIAIVKDGQARIIQIIKIAKRDESTYKGL